MGDEGKLSLVTCNVFDKPRVATPWTASKRVAELDVTAEALTYLGVGGWEEKDKEEKR